MLSHTIDHSNKSYFAFIIIAAALLTAMACHAGKSEIGAALREKAMVKFDEGYEHEKIGEYQRAVELYQQALDLSPRPAFYYQLGHSYLKLGDLNRSEKYLAAALKMQPNYPEADYDLQETISRKAQGETPSAKIDPKDLAHSELASAKDPKVLTELAKPEDSQKAIPATRSVSADQSSYPTPSSVSSSNASSGSKKSGLFSKPKFKLGAGGASSDAGIKKKGLFAKSPAPKPSPAAKTIAAAQDATTDTASTTSTEETVDPAGAKSGDKTEENPPTYAEVHKALFGNPQQKQAPEETAPKTANAKPTPEFGAPPKDSIVLGTFPYHFTNGQRYAKKKEYDRAIEEYATALGIDPENLECRLSLGECYFKKERTADALEQYQKAMKLFPSDARPHFFTGNLYIGDKTPEGCRAAREAYEKAIELNPQYAEAYNNLGVLAMAAKDNDKAIEYFSKVLAINPDYANAHLNLGILSDEYLKDKKKANEHYQRYIDLGGKRAAEVRKWQKALGESK